MPVADGASSFVARYALGALGDLGALPRYAAMLESAFQGVETPYGEAWFGRRYREVARQPSFFASLLVSDAHLEGYSAGQLWGYADQIGDARFAEGMRGHARDEARHSRMFANLIGTLFPPLREDRALTARLAAMAPSLAPGAPPGRIAAEDEVLNTAILINLHEIKALVLEALLRPIAIAYAPDGQGDRVAALIDRLIADEVHHIRYTAQFIERMAAGRSGSAAIGDAMRDFQRLLNDSTRAEVEETTQLAAALDEVAGVPAPCID